MGSENEWDSVMSSILNEKQIVDVNSYAFQHELTTMDQLLNKSPALSSRLVKWVDNLNGEPHRSDALAMNYRTLGNKFFSDPEKKQDPMALEFYTKAIYASPLDSAEVSLAHANRAAVLWRMNFHEEGYLDCQAALAQKYPDDKKLKLLHRKKNLAVACKNSDYVRESVKELIDCMKANNVAELEIEKVQKTSATEFPNDDTQAAQKKQLQNKKLTENFECTRGRYITTGQDISVEEPILEEKAFAFVPVYNDYESNHISKHCENCGKTNVIPFPCYQCARASYCSPRCGRVHNIVHHHECPGYEDNLWKRIGIAHLAVRNLVVGFETVIKGTEFEDRTTPLEFWNELMRRSETDEKFQYGQVLRLSTNFDKMDSADLLRYALTATMLITHFSEKTFFFELYEEFYQIMSYNDWVLLAAALLMRHMGQLVSNGHAISDMEFAQPSDVGEGFLLAKNSVAKGKLHGLMSSTRVFTAIFPKISLFNHSCDPNIQNRFDGSSLTVYASRDIPKDGEIFNCYGPNYKLMDQSDRKSSLKQQYCFDCDCTRCSANDQTHDKYLVCYCQNQQCRAPLTLSDTQKYWWCESRGDAEAAITCPKCAQPFNTQISYLKIISRNLYMNPSFYTDDFRRQLLESYKQASFCLSEFHEHRQNFAQIILAADVPTDISLCQSFADVILDNLNASRERFGNNSFEFVMATTYVLDFLTVTKARRSEWKDQDEFKALRMFDFEEIANSYLILSERTRLVFQKYFEQSQ